MKGAIFATALLTVLCFSSSIFAQQPNLQEVMDAVNALNARQGELLSKKDAAGIASLFTSDGLLMMLAPEFAFMPGRDAILKHYQGSSTLEPVRSLWNSRPSNYVATMGYGQLETTRSPSKTRPFRATGLGY